MNKKLLTICLVVALTLAVVCCASCKTDNTVDMLRDINVALIKEYSKVSLSVQTKLDDVTLNAKYDMTKSAGMTEITYTVDRLNGFDGINPPEEFVTRVQGTATFNGSAIVSIDGDELDDYIPLLDTVNTHMTFRLSMFSNVKVASRSFSANVTKPTEFLQDANFAGTDMTVEVSIIKGNLDSIVIAYVLDGAQVTMNYDFTL